MLFMLRRIEDVIVQLIRLVLLAFAIFVMVGMSIWLWDHYKPKKEDPTVVTPTALNWKDAPYDLKFMEAETNRDVSGLSSSVDMEKRLADPALRPSFQKADGLLRGFIYKDAALRKRLEAENSAQGLEPIHPLLKGDAIPSADDVNRQIKMREARENSCCDKEAADAAAAEVEATWKARHITLSPEERIAKATASAVAAAAADAAAEDEVLSERVNLASEIHSRAAAAEMEHGEGSYQAYILGLPAALEKILSNETLSAKLQQNSASQIVSTLTINYTMAFDRTAQVLKGENPDEEKWDFLSVDTAFASMLISCLVMVVMVLVMIRMERHMRSMSVRNDNKS